MKKLSIYAIMLFMAISLPMIFTSCGDSDDDSGDGGSSLSSASQYFVGSWYAEAAGSEYASYREVWTFNADGTCTLQITSYDPYNYETTSQTKSGQWTYDEWGKILTPSIDDWMFVNVITYTDTWKALTYDDGASHTYKKGTGSSKVFPDYTKTTVDGIEIEKNGVLENWNYTYVYEKKNKRIDKLVDNHTGKVYVGNIASTAEINTLTTYGGYYVGNYRYKYEIGGITTYFFN